MNKNLFFFSVILLGFVIVSNATVWRLNNIPGVDADFTTNLQDAVDGVTSGDTIYVEQSPFNYGEVIIDKKVILIGGGYWLAENDSTQAKIENSIVSNFIFNAGSEGSIISGLYIFRDYYNGMYLTTINADSITYSRNYIFKSSDSNIQINIFGEREAIIIEQNWIACNSYNTCGIQINGEIGNSYIRNNFFYIVDPNSYAINQLSGGQELIISNNVIQGCIVTNYAIHINNILISGTFSNGSGGIVANNICNETQFPDSNNNIRNIDMATVFVDHDLYIDNGYILSPGSPAIGAGFYDGDCGMFSNDYGGNPYVLSGLPAIPAIYEIDFNSTIFPSTENTLEVNVKAKSHD